MLVANTTASMADLADMLSPLTTSSKSTIAQAQELSTAVKISSSRPAHRPSDLFTQQAPEHDDETEDLDSMMTTSPVKLSVTARPPQRTIRQGTQGTLTLPSGSKVSNLASAFETKPSNRTSELNACGLPWPKHASAELRVNRTESDLGHAVEQPDVLSGSIVEAVPVNIPQSGEDCGTEKEDIRDATISDLQKKLAAMQQAEDTMRQELAAKQGESAVLRAMVTKQAASVVQGVKSEQAFVELRSTQNRLDCATREVQILESSRDRYHRLDSGEHAVKAWTLLSASVTQERHTVHEAIETLATIQGFLSCIATTSVGVLEEIAC